MLRAAIEQFGDKTEDEIAYGMSNFKFLNYLPKVDKDLVFFELLC